MIEFFKYHVNDIAAILSVVLPILGAIFWSHSKLHADIQEVKIECKDAHKRIDAMGMRIDAMGQRIDAMGQRIDNLYHVMMSYITKDKTC